jgi:hypothetical protein
MYHEWGRRGIHIGYWWEIQKERDHKEDQDVGEWTILKWILEQCCPTYLYIGAHLTDGCGGAGAVWRFQ